MRPRPSCGSLAWVTITALLVLLTLAQRVHGQEGRDVDDVTARPPRTSTSRSRIQVTDVRLRRSAESAIRSASARVATPGCRDLLSEFLDERGQPLAARLEALQLSFQDYLHTVIFVDGSAKPSCEGPVAVTMPGSRVVYLCARLTREPLAEAWVAIVHEVLHTLGLPENPPTPSFISNRVRKLCR